jgi:AraC-like DNA-binding protein
MPQVSNYYLTEVDRTSDTIYCMHDLMGEKDIPFHAHLKGQFLYTEGGVVHVITNHQTFFLPARHFMWIPPGVVHSIHPSSSNVMMRNLYFPVEKDELAFYTKAAIYPVNDLLLQMILFSNRYQGDIDHSMLSSFRFAMALKAILPEVSIYNLPLVLPYARDKRLEAVIKHISVNLHEIVSFPSLARQFGLSERTLSRLFQSDVGMSFIQYLTIQRMMRAVQYLLEDKLPVKEVASLVGYNSIPTFSNTFYKTLGIRPSEYVKIKGVLGVGKTLAENDILLS